MENTLFDAIEDFVFHLNNFSEVGHQEREELKAKCDEIEHKAYRFDHVVDWINNYPTEPEFQSVDLVIKGLKELFAAEGR